MTIFVRRGRLRTVASTGTASTSSTSLSERTVVSIASRIATTSSAMTSPIEKPSSESLTGAGLVFAADEAVWTTLASPEFAVESASSVLRSFWMSARAGSFGLSPLSFARSSVAVLVIVSLFRSARNTV